MNKTMNSKQAMEVFFGALGLLLLFFIFDYVAYSGIYDMPKARAILPKYRYILILLYFIIFGLVGWYNMRGLTTRNTLFASTIKKLILFGFAGGSVGGLILMNELGNEFVKWAYPILFIAGNISIGALLMGYQTAVHVKGNEMELGNEKNKNKSGFFSLNFMHSPLSG